MELDIRISVGNKIKELRKERNLSQEDLAENGRRNISIISVEKIANGLRVKIGSIF